MNTLITPSNTFYLVNVKIESECDENGKSKKYKETYIVDAKDCSDAESKIIEEMSCCNGDWEIISVSKQNISGVVK